MNGVHLGIYPIEPVVLYPIEPVVHRVLFYFNDCGEFQYWKGRNVLNSFVKISYMMTGAM